MITCYLAGPVDYTTTDDEWKIELIERVKSGGDDIAFFDPCAPYKFNVVNEDVAKYIHDVNMYALDAADILVGRIMNGQASIGTPIELYHVLKSEKPMIICTDMKKSIYMSYIGTRAVILPSMKEVYDKLAEFARTHEEKVAKFRKAVKELDIHKGMDVMSTKFAVGRNEECMKL